jgi:hypothetical protein
MAVDLNIIVRNEFSVSLDVPDNILASLQIPSEGSFVL